MSKVTVADGFQVEVTPDGYVSLSDGSGNCYFMSHDKNPPLREKALTALLIELHDQAGGNS